MTYENFFTDRRIIEKLIRLRIKEAGHRNINISDARILGNANSLPASLTQNCDMIDSEEICRLFPPRGQWLRPPKQHRNSHPTINNIYTLRRTVDILIAKPKHSQSPWAVSLKQFIINIRERALSDKELSFQIKQIRMIPKDKNRLRPVVIYSLVDRVTDSLVCDYLRSCLDDEFIDRSFAYRSKPEGKPAPTSNDAIREIDKYVSSRSGSETWVAECDIEAFFDSISHSVIKDSLARIMKRRHEANKPDIDQRALRAIDSFLVSYSFKRDVLETWQPKFQQEHPEHSGKRCKWAEPKLSQIHNGNLNVPIGIPQGAAISTVLANVVLDVADKAVVEPGTDSDLFYARYSDDIVILHKNRSQCQAALTRYCAAMSELKLPVHEPKSTEKYGRAFWECKSKQPFLWSQDRRSVTSPWISFVGYQIHINKIIRVRPSSIKKEQKKQAGITQKIVKYIKCAIYRNKHINGIDAILHSMRMRLVAMSVGKQKIYSDPGNRLPSSWTYAFEALRIMPHDSGQLRLLDRHREATLDTFRRRLRLLMKDYKFIIQTKGKGKNNRRVRYFGYPFSYFSQFESMTEPRPWRRRPRTLSRGEIPMPDPSA